MAFGQFSFGEIVLYIVRVPEMAERCIQTRARKRDREIASFLRNSSSYVVLYIFGPGRSRLRRVCFSDDGASDVVVVVVAAVLLFPP